MPPQTLAAAGLAAFDEAIAVLASLLFVSSLAVLALILILFRTGWRWSRRCSSARGGCRCESSCSSPVRRRSRWLSPARGSTSPRAASWRGSGRKGVATMTFSLFVLSAGVPDGERIFNLPALTVFVSITVHGLTDTPGAEWLARRAEDTRRRRGPQRRVLT